MKRRGPRHGHPCFEPGDTVGGTCWSPNRSLTVAELPPREFRSRVRHPPPNAHSVADHFATENTTWQNGFAADLLVHQSFARPPGGILPKTLSYTPPLARCPAETWD